MDIQKYIRVMETIKGRHEHIGWIIENARPTRRISRFTVESICLQLRMIIEDIAVACVVANANEMPGLARSLRGEYRPSRILRELEKINPLCYPIPMVENPEGRRGLYMDTHERPEGDWLTRDEIAEEYGRLSNAIHRNLKAYDGDSDDADLCERCVNLGQKIANLLSHHHITVLREDVMYRVLMSARGIRDDGKLVQGEVQVVQFVQVPDDMKQAAMRGERLDIEGIGARYE